MSITSKAAQSTSLSVSECWALARSVPVGRLAVAVEGQPDVFPVNHVVDHGTIVIRTGPGTKHAAAERHEVAFEMDGYDADTGHGWSVVVKGVAAPVDLMYDLIEALQLPVLPWQNGRKPFFLRIEPDTITGTRSLVGGTRVTQATD